MNEHSQHVDNWSAAGMAGMFDAVHRQRDRARYRRRVFFWCLTIAICLGIPLAITWEKFQDARRQTLLEEFASRRPAAEKLTLSNPAIASALTRADALRNSARTSSIAEAIVNLRQSLQLLTDAHNQERDTKRVRQILDPVGLTLLETPWHVSSTVISQQQKELGERHKSIVALLDQGKVELAEQSLAKLLSDIGELQRGNVEAMQTSLSRQVWIRRQTSIPGRLANDPAWKAINSVGDDAEQGWDAGDWLGARTLYARAVERSEQFLDSQLDPAEKTKLLQSDADALARLETEKADLNREVVRLEEENANQTRQLATIIIERQAALEQVKLLTTERDRLRTESANDRSELKELRPLKDQLAAATKSRDAAQQQVAQLTAAKQTAEDLLAQTESRLAARVAEVQALRTAARSGNGNSPIVQVSATLAAINSQLAADIKGKDVQAAAELARERLADALKQYDDLVRQKQDALKKFQPTGRTVREIEATISQAEATLASILKVLDEPLAAQYDNLQGVISAAEANYNEVIKDALPETEGPRKLKSRIDGLKAQQTRLAAARSRYTGKTIPSGSELVSLCREQVQELLAERQRAEFARLRAAGEIPAAASIEFVPISAGKFMMGSNDQGADDDEKPVHEVTITKPFFAGKYEVTVGQVLKWLNSGAKIDEEWVIDGGDYSPVKKSGSRWVLNTSSKFGESDQQPMVSISWYGAKAFCEGRNRRSSGRFGRV